MTATDGKTLLREGAKLHLAGKLAEAEQKYREALTLNENSAVAHNNLGFLYAQQRQFAEAIREYNRAIELSPEYSTAYTNLGQAYLVMQQTEEAEKFLQQAISFDENDFHANESLAKLYLMKGEGGRSEFFWRKAYSIEQRSSILVELAHCLLLQGKMEEAMNVIDRVLQDDEENPRLYSMLGVIHFARLDFGTAIKCFKRALGFQPENAEVRHNLAMALIKVGEGDEAILELKRIVLLDPAHSEARNNLAVLEMSSGEMDSALNHFEIVLQQEPQNAKALYYKSVILFQKGKHVEVQQTLNDTISTGHADYAPKAMQLLASMN